MLDGRLLNKLTGTHEKDDSKSDNDSDAARPTPDSHTTATDATRVQSTRPRRNTTLQSPTKAPPRKMAGGGIYERLEGGLGPQRGPVGRHNWKKYAIIAGLVIGVSWFAAPHSEKYLWNKDKGTNLLSLCWRLTDSQRI